VWSSSGAMAGSCKAVEDLVTCFHESFVLYDRINRPPLDKPLAELLQKCSAVVADELDELRLELEAKEIHIRDSTNLLGPACRAAAQGLHDVLLSSFSAQDEDTFEALKRAMSTCQTAEWEAGVEVCRKGVDRHLGKVTVVGRRAKEVGTQFDESLAELRLAQWKLRLASKQWQSDARRVELDSASAPNGSETARVEAEAARIEAEAARVEALSRKVNALEEEKLRLEKTAEATKGDALSAAASSHVNDKLGKMGVSGMDQVADALAFLAATRAMSHISAQENLACVETLTKFRSMARARQNYKSLFEDRIEATEIMSLVQAVCRQHSSSNHPALMAAAEQILLDKNLDVAPPLPEDESPRRVKCRVVTRVAPNKVSTGMGAAAARRVSAMAHRVGRVTTITDAPPQHLCKSASTTAASGAEVNGQEKPPPRPSAAIGLVNASSNSMGATITCSTKSPSTGGLPQHTPSLLTNIL